MGPLGKEFPSPIPLLESPAGEKTLEYGHTFAEEIAAEISTASAPVAACLEDRRPIVEAKPEHPISFAATGLDGTKKSAHFVVCEKQDDRRPPSAEHATSANGISGVHGYEGYEVCFSR